ncbi:hypothetical protein D9M68_658200 [compost metagenome]
MQLVAGQVLVDVAGLDDVLVLQLRRIELVAVVGDVQLLLADQFPVVAVRRAVVHVVVVGGRHAVGGGRRAVVGHLGRAPHAALAGVVEPRLARFLDLVDGLVHQQHVAGQARRGVHPLDEVEQGILPFRLVEIGQVGRIGNLVLEMDHGEGAAHLRLHAGDVTVDVTAAVTGLVVPHHLDAGLRDREGVVVAVEVLQAVAAADQLGLPGAGADRLVHLVRQGRGAMARVDRNFVGIRVALEHRHLAGGQLVLVLLGVGRGDGEQRLLAGEGIGQEALGVHRAGIGRQASGPGGDGAVGIAGLLRAHGRQGGAQLGDLVGGNRGHHAAGEQRKGQGPGLEQGSSGKHVRDLLLQKFIPRLNATKSRSIEVLKSPPKKSV